MISHRLTTRAALGVATAFLVASCGSDSGSDAGAAAEAASTVSTSTPSALPTGDPRLPDGTYRTPDLTVDQLIATGLAAGFKRADVEEFVGQWPADPKRIVFTLKLEAGRWTEFETVDGGPAEIGWAGTFKVIDDDTVVNNGDCGTITFRYALQGDELTLDMVEDKDCDADQQGELIAGTTIYGTAPFTKIQ